MARGTEGNFETSIESRRHKELSQGIELKDRADTWPTTSATALSSQGEDGKSREKDVPGTSDSQDPINVSRDIDTEDGVPRRRKTGISSAPTEDDDAKTAGSTGSRGKPVFTVGSQLRATIFNSWINLLLFCVPAGSAFQPFYSSLL